MRIVSLKIVELDKTKWKGYRLPIEYANDEFYDVKVENNIDFQITITRKKVNVPLKHSQEDQDYPDALFADWCVGAKAYGITKGDQLLAVIECYPESWCNRLRISELFVSRELRRQGIGTQLMNVVKDEARKNKYRAIVLETQTCNVVAIDFYRSQGFVFNGVDCTNYSNDDIQRKEVRLELAYLFDSF